jgi:hypothetical protein
MTDFAKAVLMRRVTEIQEALVRASVRGDFEAAQQLRATQVELCAVLEEADLDEQAEAHEMALAYGYGADDYGIERAEAMVECQRDWEADQADGAE